jgi:hypothetical protein
MFNVLGTPQVTWSILLPSARFCVYLLPHQIPATVEVGHSVLSRWAGLRQDFEGASAAKGCTATVSPRYLFAGLSARTPDTEQPSSAHSSHAFASRASCGERPSSIAAWILRQRSQFGLTVISLVHSSPGCSLVFFACCYDQQTATSRCGSRQRAPRALPAPKRQVVPATVGADNGLSLLGSALSIGIVRYAADRDSWRPVHTSPQVNAADMVRLHDRSVPHMQIRQLRRHRHIVGEIGHDNE